MRIYHVEVPRLAVLLAAVDVAAVSAVVLAAKSTGFGPVSAAGPAVLLWSIVIPAFAMGLYQRSFLGLHRLPTRAVSVFAAAVLLQALASEVGLLDRFDLTAAALSLAGVSALVLNRLVTCRLAETPTFKSRVLLIGDDRSGRRLAEIEARARPARFVQAGFIPAEGGAEAVACAFRDSRIDAIVLDVAGEPEGALADVLLRARLAGARVETLGTFVERETRQIEVDDREALRLIFSEGSQRGAASRLVKRILDVTASLAILLTTLPLMLLAGLAVVLCDRGPMFYRQERVGLGGRSFRIMKFRTMRVDAEADGVARWAVAGDRRTTAVGRFLRKSRIDELPQILNVLRGDMSLVGPRPERPQIVAELEAAIPLYAHRHLVPPGLTGWAQINYPYGASLADAEQKTAYDLYYLKNGSVILDLVILVQTVRVVLLAEGSR